MARGLLIATFDCTNAHAAEFHDGYDCEHTPRRAAVPGFDLCERWIADQAPNCAVATYDLELPQVAHSAAWQLAVDTPWSARVAATISRSTARPERALCA